MRRATPLLVLVLAAVLSAAAHADTRPVPTGPLPPPEAVAVASAAAGKPVTIVCVPWEQWTLPPSLGDNPLAIAGYSQTGGDTMTLRWDSCQGLALLLDDPAGAKEPLGTEGPMPWETGDPTEWETRAWGYVLHEAQHLRGTLDETDAECGMLDALPGVLAQLGVPLERVGRMTQIAVAAHAARPAAYQTRPCPPGSVNVPLVTGDGAPPRLPPWTLSVEIGPVAPQTIPYLTQGLADPSTLGGL